MNFTKKDNGIYRGEFTDGKAIILSPEGNRLVVCSTNPTNNEPWTETAALAWIDAECDAKNKAMAQILVNYILAGINVAYNNAMDTEVLLPDGRVFGPTKSAGGGAISSSLENTVRLIRDGCDMALYAGLSSITLSDHYNQDATYEFDLESKNPNYIMPIVQLGIRISALFEIKRLTRNAVNSMLAGDTFDFDIAEAMDGEAMFNAEFAKVIAASEAAANKAKTKTK